MEITFDPAKSERNRAERGLSFDAVSNFDFSSAIVRPTRRADYPDTRYEAIGLLSGLVHFVVFTPVTNGIRVISLRRAHRKERAQWHDANL